MMLTNVPLQIKSCQPTRNGEAAELCRPGRSAATVLPLAEKERARFRSATESVRFWKAVAISALATLFLVITILAVAVVLGASARSAHRHVEGALQTTEQERTCRKADAESP
jgi:hypothetical protein